jgi:hypothetical protein
MREHVKRMVMRSAGAAGVAFVVVAGGMWWAVLSEAASSPPRDAWFHGLVAITSIVVGVAAGVFAGLVAFVAEGFPQQGRSSAIAATITYLIIAVIGVIGRLQNGESIHVAGLVLLWAVVWPAMYLFWLVRTGLWIGAKKLVHSLKASRGPSGDPRR